MNTKELGELRRRLRPNKNAISHVYGCYVGAAKEIIGEVDQSLALLSEDDAEGCLSLLKKALSGGLGRNPSMWASPPSRWRRGRSTRRFGTCGTPS